MSPDTLHDDDFGELLLIDDPPMSHWIAEVALAPDSRIDVVIWWDEAEDGPFAPVIERARAAYHRFRRREPEHRHALAAALLERLPDSSRKDVGYPNIVEIAQALRVIRLAITADGSATVRYDDAGEFFGDQSIYADIDSNGSFAGFALHG